MLNLSHLKLIFCVVTFVAISAMAQDNHYDVYESEAAADKKRQAKDQANTLPSDSSSEGINANAKDGADALSMGSVANSTFAAYMWPSCGTGNGWACYMAASSTVEALNQLKKRDQARAVQYATDIPQFEEEVFGRDGSSPGMTKSDLERKLKDFESKGYKIGKDSITTPEGEKIPTSALGSAKAMAGAGLISPGEIDDVQSKINAANGRVMARINSKGNGFRSHGGNTRHWQNKPKTTASPSFNYNSLFGKANKRKPSSVAGLHRLAGGEPIGVKVDDIFQMVHRRYQDKRSSNLFNETLAPRSK